MTAVRTARGGDGILALHLLDSGHSPMFEDPDAVAAILRRAFAAA